MSDKGTITRSKIMYEFDMLIRKQGYTKTTQRQLADVCGISRGHIGFYFPKKEDLILSMYQDYWARVNIVMDTYTRSAEDELLALFVHQLFSYYVVSDWPEVHRIASELAENTRFANYRAQKTHDLAEEALHSIGFDFDSQDLLYGSICAAHAVYAMINYWYLNKMPLDHQRLFCIYSDILLSQINFPYTKEYQDRALSIFEKQDTELMLKEFKALLDYNYVADKAK